MKKLRRNKDVFSDFVMYCYGKIIQWSRLPQRSRIKKQMHVFFYGICYVVKCNLNVRFEV